MLLFYIIGSVVVSFVLFLCFKSTIQSDLESRFPELKAKARPRQLPKSPYSITHSTAKDKSIGYSILKDGEPVKIAGAGSAFVVYSSYSSVMEDLNRMERQAGTHKPLANEKPLLGAFFMK